MNTVNRSELKAKYGNEMVFVVHQDDIPFFEEGFTLQRPDVLDVLQSKGVFAPRYLVEYNTIVRQPIPYILVRQDGMYFATTRLDGSGEARLHGKMSLGVGGHINPVDSSDNMFLKAMTRELFEELTIKGQGEINLDVNFHGVINDNSNAVSQDHIGLVFVVDAQNLNVEVRETDKLVGGFYTIEELSGNYERLESWSQIVFDVIQRGYIK